MTLILVAFDNGIEIASMWLTSPSAGARQQLATATASSQVSEAQEQATSDSSSL